MYKHILIPTDGSPTADKAVEAGLAFARDAGARVTFFTAVPEYEMPGEAALMARMRASAFREYPMSSRRSAAISSTRPSSGIAASSAFPLTVGSAGTSAAARQGIGTGILVMVGSVGS